MLIQWVKTCIVTDNELLGMAPLGAHPEEPEGGTTNCSSFSVKK